MYSDTGLTGSSTRPKPSGVQAESKAQHPVMKMYPALMAMVRVRLSKTLGNVTLDIPHAISSLAPSPHDAADAIKALACGYPPRVWPKKLMVALQAFVDDSA